jgi:hypothetical protein
MCATAPSSAASPAPPRARCSCIGSVLGSPRALLLAALASLERAGPVIPPIPVPIA